MKASVEFVVAIFVALAILAVFIYPLTFGPPAPQQKLFGALSLLFSAIAAIPLLFATAARAHCMWQAVAVAPSTTSERLALSCARLC